MLLQEKIVLAFIPKHWTVITAVEILSDMILNPVFNPVHIETEKMC